MKYLLSGLVGNTIIKEHRRLGSNPDAGRSIVASRAILNYGPLSLGTIPSGRLKNLKDVDK